MQLNGSALNSEPINGWSNNWVTFVNDLGDSVEVTDSEVLREFVLTYSDILSFFDDSQGTVDSGGGGGGTVVTRTAEDILQMSDELLSFLLRLRVVSDSADASDERTNTVYRNRSQDESVEPTDGGFDTEWVVDTDDAVAVSDELRSFAFYFRYLDEALLVVDDVVKQVIGSGVTFSSTVEDFIELIDGNQRWLGLLRDISDTLEVSDDALRTLLRARLLEDVVELSDVTTYAAFRTRVADELISVIEEVVGTQSGTGVITSATVSDVIDVLDFTAYYRLVTRDSIETVSVVDDLLSFRRVFRFIEDTLLTVDEAVSAITGGTVFSSVLQDSVSLIDLIHSTVERGRVSSDDVALTDDQFKSLQFVRDAVETIVIEDGVARFTLLRRFVEDVLGVDDPFISLYLPVLTFVVRVRLGADEGPRLGVSDDGIRLGADDLSIILGSDY